MPTSTPDTEAFDDPPDVQPLRSTIATRRRAWVIEALKSGRTHPDIAEALGITRERVRQIAKEALEGHRVEPPREHTHLQIARLTPALTLASEGVARGDMAAIGPLLKILDRLDAYQARVMTLDIPSQDPNAAIARQAFMEKMERAKNYYRSIGLSDEVQTLAEAYALTEVLVEGAAQKATASTAPDTPPNATEEEAAAPNSDSKPNEEGISD